MAGGLLAMTPQLMSAAEPQDVETIDAENHEIGYGIINPGVAMSTVSGDHFYTRSSDDLSTDIGGDLPGL